MDNAKKLIWIKIMRVIKIMRMLTSSQGFTGFEHMTNKLMSICYFLDEHTENKVFS